MLIAHRLSQRETSSALTAAQDAAAVLPDNLQVLNALGQAQLAAGDVQQAISSFGKVAAAQPTSPQPQLPSGRRLPEGQGPLGRCAQPAQGAGDHAGLPARAARPDPAGAGRQARGRRAGDRAHGAEAATEGGDRLPARGRDPGQPAALGRRDRRRPRRRFSAPRPPTSRRASRRSTLAAGRHGRRPALRRRMAREHPRDAGFFFGIGSIALASGTSPRPRPTSDASSRSSPTMPGA